MSSSRKGNQNYSQSPKRKYTCVSPASPEMAVTMGNLRKILKEELMPIQSQFDEFKKSIDFTSNIIGCIHYLCNIQVLCYLCFFPTVYTTDATLL